MTAYSDPGIDPEEKWRVGDARLVLVNYHGDTPDDTIVIWDGSVGAVRCGVNFNPSGNPDVRKLKSLAAAFMQCCHDIKVSRTLDDHDGRRCFETAMTQMESAQMFAVKGLFTIRNAEKE